MLCRIAELKNCLFGVSYHRYIYSRPQTFCTRDVKQMSLGSRTTSLETKLQSCLQLKLCLYTIVHFLLEELKNFSPVILKYTILTSHSWCLLLGPKSESGVLIFLTLETESHKQQGLHITVSDGKPSISMPSLEKCFCDLDLSTHDLQNLLSLQPECGKYLKFWF